MKIKTLFIWVFLGIIISLVLYSTYFKGSFDSEFKKSWELDILKNHFLENDLLLLDTNIGYDKFTSDWDLDEWHNYIKINYRYEEKTYDCKYWALVWALYFEKHNVEYNFITTSNHIFVIAEFKNKYCTADGDILNCYYFNK